MLFCLGSFGILIGRGAKSVVRKIFCWFSSSVSPKLPVYLLHQGLHSQLHTLQSICLTKLLAFGFIKCIQTLMGWKARKPKSALGVVRVWAHQTGGGGVGDPPCIKIEIAADSCPELRRVSHPCIKTGYVSALWYSILIGCRQEFGFGLNLGFFLLYQDRV